MHSEVFGIDTDVGSKPCQHPHLNSVHKHMWDSGTFNKTGLCIPGAAAVEPDAGNAPDARHGSRSGHGLVQAQSQLHTVGLCITKTDRESNWTKL